MIPKIKSLEPMDDYCLRVVFDDGKAVLYDAKEDIKELPGYQALATIQGLFRQVQVDSSRTCVFWNEDIDLPSDVIYTYGTKIKSRPETGEGQRRRLHDLSQCTANP